MPVELVFGILGPGLFLYYINDLQSRLTSTVRLFADDIIAYLTISINNDAETLQKDLDKLDCFCLQASFVST
jgi:hypothetical protein